MGRTVRGTRHCQPVLSPYAVATAPVPLHEGNVQIRPLTTPSGRSAPVKKVKTRKPVAPAKVRKVGLGAFGGDDDYLKIERIGPKKVSTTAATTQQSSKQGNVASTAGTLGDGRAKPGKNALAASIAAVLNNRPLAVLQREDYERRVTQQKASANIIRRELRDQDADDEDEDDSDDDAGLEQLLVTSLRREQPSGASTSANASDVPLASLDVPILVSSLSDWRIEPHSEPRAAAPVADRDSTLAGYPAVKPSHRREILSRDITSRPQLGSHHALGTKSSEAMDVDATPAAIPVVASWKTILNPPPAVPTLSPAALHLSTAPNAADAPAPNAQAVALAVRGRAAALTAGRTRKLKKKRRAELFDYLSDDSEDWDAPATTAVPKRAKGGRALDGAEPYTAAGIATANVLPIDPDLLPATRAAAEKLFPTNYQSALLQQAKEGNVICVLPTGSGKTLVAVLLMDWMFNLVELPRVERGIKKRLQFFLTNSVPLVHQQANILAHNSSLRVGKLFGALGVNLSNAEEWAFNFEHYDCLVLTAQLLLDSLAHGFVSMSQISLMVFDEAHHAKSNHPFASILRDFYGRVPESQDRPRILGLTASPLNSNEGLAEAEHLQMLFDAKLVTAPDETLQELREMVAKPTELTFKYRAPPRYLPTPLFTAIHEKVVFRDAEFERFSRAAQIALAEYGPDASDLVFHLALAKWVQKVERSADSTVADAIPEPEVANKTGDADFDIIHPHAETVPPEDPDAMEQEKPKDAVEEDPSSRIPDWLREVQLHKSQPKLKNLSPKLQTLIKVLGAYQHASETFCGIVFVNRRVDALLIAHLLRQFSKTLPELSWLRVRCVTGHGTSANKSLGPRMQWAEQAEILTDFGEGNCNLLVATSVVEEGLDVQPCCFVARFDLYATHISMAQSRGRARRAGSHYVLFVQEGSYSDERKIARIREFDNKMTELLHAVDAQYSDGDYGADDDDETEAYYIEPSTNALLTPHFSVALLYRYCQSLPQSDAFNVGVPRFELTTHGVDSYTCSILLPPSARIRAVQSDRCETPKAAKRHASYICCKLLRHVGALDEHLLPILTFPPPEEVRDEQGKVIGSKKRQLGYEKKLADDWTVQVPFAPEGESDLWGMLLAYDGEGGTLNNHGDIYQPIVLLSRNLLPSVPPLKLFIEGEPVHMFATPIAVPFKTTKAQRETLRGYTLRVFKSTLNRALDVDVDEMLYFVAPLDGVPTGDFISIDDLDWSSMEYAAAVQEEELKLDSLPDLTDRVIVDLGKNSCRYFYTKTRPDLHPSSQLPPGRQSDAGFGTVIDYYLSFNEPLFHKMHIKEEQPLFEVTRMPKVVSYLTATPRNNRVPRFAIPQLCSRHSIPSSLFRTYLMLPSILTELDQLMLIQELNAKVFNNDLDIARVRSALTCPSACLEENYERLELLGTSRFILFYFESLELTILVQAMHSSMRLHHIQNATLFKAGLELNLPAYLVSRPFTSRLFVPPNFKLLRGQPPPHLASIRDKTIADVCEALMGAAYETGAARGGLEAGFECALRAALALKVALTGVEKWSDMRDMFGPIEDTPTLAEGPLLIEQKLNHRFKHSHLLTEALTHPSKLNASASFQRLEWLGDSILDFLVLGYCWDRWGGALPPGHLTELKGAMVSNETLAALAVELELDKYLSYDNPSLTASLETYRSKVTKAKETEVREAAEEAREVRPFWLLLDAPKAVADIIESLFGAVFVDCGFSPEGPQASFNHLLVPFFAEWVSPTKLKIDAIRILLETAQAAACDDVSHISSTVDGRITESGEVFPRMTKTSVIAHGEILASCVTQNSKTAKRLVSANALQYLDRHPDFFAKRCDCEKVRAIAKEEAEELAARRRLEGLESEHESDWEDDDGDESDTPGDDRMMES
ncbi:hypothetical protein RQP46_000323 [Phenoliferia psychrophenolica]